MSVFGEYVVTRYMERAGALAVQGFLITEALDYASP